MRVRSKFGMLGEVGKWTNPSPVLTCCSLTGVRSLVYDHAGIRWKNLLADRATFLAAANAGGSTAVAFIHKCRICRCR